MWMHYVLRELARRRRQAAAVSAGLAVAVAIVIVMSGISAGLASAQSTALASLYGVGTDVTITRPVAGGATPAPQFTFASGAGTAAGGSTALTQSQLSVARGLTTIPSSDQTTVAGLPQVATAEGVLLLDNYDFSGIIPSITGGQAASGEGPAAPTGADGAGGSAFGVDTFSVAGVDPARADGTLAGMTVTAGRGFAAADAGQRVALVDQLYATENQISVGAPVNIGGVDIPVVGLVAAPSGRPSIAQSYLPLDIAQSLSGQAGQITSVYVTTTSAADVAAVTTAAESALPGAHVATQADLASTMTGTLASASDVSASIGLWLSIIALAAAVLIAALLTIVGVTRRSREFGTLKALGWSSGAIVSQVLGESLVQGLIGGVAGVVLAGIAVVIGNLAAPTLMATAATTGASTHVALSLAFPWDTVALGIGLALIASLAAAVAGSFRVASLRPSESLRSDQ